VRFAATSLDEAPRPGLPGSGRVAGSRLFEEQLALLWMAQPWPTIHNAAMESVTEIPGVDEELRAAAKEVDRGLLEWARSLTPLERVRHLRTVNRTISRLRRAKTRPR